MPTTRRVSLGLVALLSLCGLGVAAASATIVPVGQFVGELSDSFNQNTAPNATQSLDVFQGAATLSNLTEGGAIKVETNSRFNGDLVLPRSRVMVGQLGRGRWEFASPAIRFGGWFENNSGADDATLYFYDATDNLIGLAVAGVPADPAGWRWNGWESDLPFTRIDVVGNGVIEGFIWYEDMQLVTVPEPAAGLLLLMGASCVLARRRMMNQHPIGSVPTVAAS